MSKMNWSRPRGSFAFRDSCSRVGRAADDELSSWKKHRAEHKKFLKKLKKKAKSFSHHAGSDPTKRVTIPTHIKRNDRAIRAEHTALIKYWEGCKVAAGVEVFDGLGVS